MAPSPIMCICSFSEPLYLATDVHGFSKTFVPHLRSVSPLLTLPSLWTRSTFYSTLALSARTRYRSTSKGRARANVDLRVQTSRNKHNTLPSMKRYGDSVIRNKCLRLWIDTRGTSKNDLQSIAVVAKDFPLRLSQLPSPSSC